MDREALIRMAQSDPKFAQVIEMIRSQIGEMDIEADELDEAIQMFELMLNQPEAYPQIREAAIDDGVIDPEDLPEQYDPIIIVSFLVVLYGLQDSMRAAPQMAMAQGGLAQAARAARSAGRYGDTQLVHMNPAELGELRSNWGKPTINPETGLPEFFLGKLWKGIKSVLKVAAPIILSVVAPGVGTWIGTQIGLAGTAASIAGGAILGGATSGLTGGNVLKGALMGGLGGGLGQVAGGAANKALGLGLGKAGQAVLGSGLLGGISGAATGQGFLAGAGQGVLGGAIGQLAGGVNAPNAFQQAVQSAGKGFGQALTAGYNPKEAALVGATAGLMRGATYKAPVSPSTQVVDAMAKGTQPTTQTVSANVDPNQIVVNQDAINKVVAGLPTGVDGGVIPSQTAAAPSQGGLGNVGKYLALASAASSLLSAPKEVQQAVQQLSPEQQEYFNRPSISWDWNKLQRDATNSGMGLSQFMATNWNALTGGAYNTGMAQGGHYNTGHQGALSAVSRFARGAGSGRDDLIDAKLSDGEYVMDAETVSMLGDGSSKEGARRLEEMRKNIRQHKGKTLAKGKFSPNAKSPLSYLKGAA